MFRDKLKELIGKKEEQQEGNDKKKIENLVFLIILSIITIVIINIIWNGNKKEDKKETDSNSKQLATTNQITNDSKNNVQLTDNLEEKLENIEIETQAYPDEFIQHGSVEQLEDMYLGKIEL